MTDAAEGLGHKARGDHAAALAAFLSAARTEPANPSHPLEAGLAFMRLGRWAEAAEQLAEAATLAPHSAAPRYNLGVALRFNGRLEAARRSFQAALEADPRFSPAWQALAAVTAEQGHQEEAWDLRRRMESMLGAEAPAILLESAVNYHGGLDRETVFGLHQRWGRWAETRTAPLPGRIEALPDPHRRLRVGYVSPDLRQHACASFIEPLWAFHDPLQVEIHAYADSVHEDASTARLKGLAHQWRNIAGLDAAQAAALIHGDGIDILLDLAGHTNGRQLLVFAHRPAPIQAAWLGYPNTTGLTRMDARLTDGIADPPGAEAWHTERLVRLPRFLCYRPPGEAPDPGSPPMLTTGRCTFASFNNPSKVGRNTVALWSRLLLRVAGSRLLMKAAAFSDQGTRESWVQRFAQSGVPRDSLEFRPFSESAADHLAQYQEVDIALDPFPYNGTTTTCEALWMGVPVVALEGDRHAGRTGMSLLTAIDRKEWIAPTPAAYLDLAADLAADPQALATHRAGLRRAMAASPLCDAKGFASSMECAFRTLWRDHLEPR